MPWKRWNRAPRALGNSIGGGADPLPGVVEKSDKSANPDGQRAGAVVKLLGMKGHDGPLI